MAILPFTIQLSYAGTPAGTITYNAGTDTITVSGANSTHPAEFLDLYNADVAGGWGQVYMQNSTQFSFACKIINGDGSTPTYFADTLKQVIFVDGSVASWEWAIQVKNGSTFTLGTLVDATDKTTKNGCQITSLDADANHYIIGDSYTANTDAKIYLYDSKLQSANADAILGQVQTTTTIKAYNCQFDRVFLSTLSSNSELYNTNLANCLEAISGCNAVMDRINVYASTNIYFALDIQSTIKNLLMRSNTRAFRVWSITVDQYLINPDFDSWETQWGGDSSAEVYRQYEFDLFVLNGEITDFVENANVTLTHDGTVYGSWLANSTGQIPTQTLTYGFYNQTGGDTMYGGTPWTLTITHPDWETYTSAFYPYSEIDWSISMQDTSTSNNNMLLAGLLMGGIAFLGIIVIRRKT